MNRVQLGMLQMELLIAVSIAVCCAVNPVLASNTPDPAFTPTDAYANLPCQPDSALNALLVQMLMAIQPYLILQQQQQQAQQQQPSWRRSNNELYPTTPEPLATTVVTSSIISTLTQTVSKVISIWFRNERIPTTLYSQTTTLATDYITVTSTLPAANVRPTETVRVRRELDDATQLDSSIIAENDHSGLRTGTLPLTEIPVSALPLSFLKEPRLVEAWNSLLQVLAETYSNHTDNTWRE